jgi:hypothetical protein
MSFLLFFKFQIYFFNGSIDRESIVGCLLHLAKRRPQFLTRILTAVECVHANVPETYSRLEVEGLRKYLKVRCEFFLFFCFFFNNLNQILMSGWTDEHSQALR